MKVLHVHEKFWPYNGGSTTRLLNLIDTSNNKHQVVDLSYFDKVTKTKQLEDIYKRL